MVEVLDKTMIRAEARRIRRIVIEQRGASCVVCGFDYEPVLVIHHIMAIGKGGVNDHGNLTVLCPTCHALVHRIYAITRLRSNHPRMSQEVMTRAHKFDVLKEWVESRLGHTALGRLIDLCEEGKRRE